MGVVGVCTGFACGMIGAGGCFAWVGFWIVADWGLCWLVVAGWGNCGFLGCCRVDII